jgi:DNA topoisomerase VI subunit B
MKIAENGKLTSNGYAGRTIVREAFRTSRLLDFCSKKELVAQTGHADDDWPLVVLKELVDNSLDACEDAGVAPRIDVTVDDDGITVADNGPGIPTTTVAGVLDFSIRVSSREAYVSPCRGAQGNALQTLVAMPFVLDGQQGQVTVAAKGIRHDISMRVDRIRQEPVLHNDQEPDTNANSGTRVHIAWPKCACQLLDDAKARFVQIGEDFAILNPHATLRMVWKNERTFAATDPGWRKWLPSNPTSAHWYDLERFGRLVAAYVALDADRSEDRTVRKFVAEFDGLTRSAKGKLVLEATGLARVNLSHLANGDGLDEKLVQQLLDAMKEHTRPVKAKALGVIGKDHVQKRFEALGCEQESFRYKRRFGETDGIPWVQETAFGYCPNQKRRRLVTGVNWSPGIVNPFRQLGRFGRSLDSVLSQLKAAEDEPIVVLLHVACPRVEYRDRGKSAVVIGTLGPTGHDKEEML